MEQFPFGTPVFSVNTGKSKFDSRMTYMIQMTRMMSNQYSQKKADLLGGDAYDVLLATSSIYLCLDTNRKCYSQQSSCRETFEKHQ